METIINAAQEQLTKNFSQWWDTSKVNYALEKLCLGDFDATSGYKKGAKRIAQELEDSGWTIETSIYRGIAVYKAQKEDINATIAISNGKVIKLTVGEYRLKDDNYGQNIYIGNKIKQFNDALKEVQTVLGQVAEVKAQWQELLNSYKAKVEALAQAITEQYSEYEVRSTIHNGQMEMGLWKNGIGTMYYFKVADGKLYNFGQEVTPENILQIIERKAA